MSPMPASSLAPWLLLAALLAAPPAAATPPAVLPADEAAVTAADAYVYAYPLVLMELARRVATNVGDGAPAGTAGAPMNQFAHQRAFADATAVGVVRPEVDTLASSLWFDVGREPLVLAIPDSGGRHYLLPLLDLWSDVFAALGPRTTGTSAQTYALTGPDWQGALPDGVVQIVAPTNVGWIPGRVQSRGGADLAAAHRFQDGLRAVPLSHWGADYTPPRGTFDPTLDMRPPLEQLPRLAVGAFFALATELMARNPPHAHDYPILLRMARLGLVAGKPFTLAAAPPAAQTAFRGAPMAAGLQLFEGFKRAGTRANGWRLILQPMGTYGADYRRRQVVAYSGLGAPLLEDALTLTTMADGEGKPLEGVRRYVLRFAATDLPPANAQWSVTLYDERQLPTANGLRRASLGDRDPLVRNADGSLDLLIQRDSPGPDREANWLPAPAEGRFSMSLRLHWPKPEALDGTWQPPPVTLAATAPVKPE